MLVYHSGEPKFHNTRLIILRLPSRAIMTYFVTMRSPISAMRNLLTGVLSLAFILLIPGKLFSQLFFKNTSTEEVYIAIRHMEDGVWKTQGWYRIGPLQTERTLPKITNTYYYYHARSGDGKMVWSGTDAYGWVHKNKTFTTLEKKNYPASQGYERKGLKKIDVGDVSTFTHTLDFRTEFVIQLEKYFSKDNLDPVEGMYSLSDDITIETNAGAGGILTSHEKRNYWAKVAIVKDSISVSRSYVEFVLEADVFKEGAVRAEFLQTNSPKLFMSEQRTKPGDPKRTVALEFNPDTGVMEGKFEYTGPRKKYTVKRSYLKYFPK